MRNLPSGRYEILWRGRPSLWFFSGTIGASVILSPFLIGFLMLFLTYLAWRATNYVIANTKVGIERGILIRSTRELRISDIRSIEVRRSGFAGLFGMGDIILSTAARDDASICFHGIANAEAITDLIRECQEGRKPPAFGSDLHSGAGVFTFATLASILLTVIAAGAAQQQYSLALSTPTPRPTSLGRQIVADVAQARTDDSRLSTPVAAASSATPLGRPSPELSATALVALSQKAAVAKYPRLGMSGSRENTLFITRLTAWRINHDPRLDRSDWPERLADDCAARP